MALRTGSLLACLLACLAAGGVASGPAPFVSGPPERVFDWERARCERWDIPDAPARAWRDEAGRLRLIAGAEATRASVGPTLDALVRDCAALHRGSGDDDPAAYDDRAWIASVFAAGGRRVEALAHVEYHGHLRRDRCPVGDYAACWANAIVALESEDGGRTFLRAEGGALVAALPYRYDGAHGRRAGYFSPSNVLRRGDHLYVFVFAERYRAQRRGACLLRRPVDGGPRDWRTWDGRGFIVRFADPWREDIADPAAHVCAPVAGLRSTVSSVVQRGGRFLAVTAATTRTGAEGALRVGIHWSLSDDLLTWSAPELLFAAPLLWRRDCGAPAAFAYPSLIDPDSASPSFDSVDGGFWLYLSEMPVQDGCRIGPRRNLIRMPVSWPG